MSKAVLLNMGRNAEAIPLVNLGLSINGSAYLERRLAIFSRFSGRVAQSL
jgi:hypothetical protein